MVGWRELSAFMGVDLTRSEVLRWHESDKAFMVEVRGILSPLHPAFERPGPGSEECCKPCRVVFPFPQEIHGLRPMREARSDPRISDAASFGPIEDLLEEVDGSYRVSGPFGELKIRSMPVRFEVTSQRPCA